MYKRVLKISLISIVGIILAAYLLFLIAPFVVNPIIKGYSPKIRDEIQKSTGFDSKIDGVALVTTPKLTAGLKIKEFALINSKDEQFMTANDFQVKMSLIPLLAKKLEIDAVSLKNLDLKLNINKKGEFADFVDLMTKSESDNDETTSQFVLPFGLKLSNHLPNIKIGGYNISFVDLSTGKLYVLSGNKTAVSDFVLNKHVKVQADGNLTLDGREQFVYKLKVNNKIMPDVDLNDLVFNSQPQEETNQNNEFSINIIDIFKGLYNYYFTANIDGDLTLTPDGQSGTLVVNNLSVAPNGVKLPASDISLKFKENKVNVDANLYTAKDEASTLSGTVKTGKHTNIDMTFKSGAELANVVKIVNAVAMTFNIKDLQTLSASGKIDANFNIKSDLKSVTSNGYLKIPSAKVYYGLYDVAINAINADVALDNNNINIKNLGFTILNQPLKIYGTIKQDATTDLHVLAQNLSLKGLLVACGQAELLKENTINSGLVNLNADIVGKLDSIKPTAKVVLSNINLKNVPSSTTLKLPKTTVDVQAEGESFNGTILSENLKVLNPAANISIPKVSANLDESVIDFSQTSVNIEKINFKLVGKIKNYMTEKIGLDFTTSGDINSTLSGTLNIIKQTLNLNFVAKESTIIVPMFDKSKMSFTGNIGITGTMLNPLLNGTFNVSSLNIPEIPVTMTNLVAKINGEILNGKATLASFASGGIVAENLSSDFAMKGNDFYLNNLSGNAFKGKISGNIVYNLANAQTTVDFKGENMDATSAIYGATGIKNALSGTLGFNTKLKLVVADYDEMMRSLSGDLSFKVANGAFGSIGRLENFLGASNIVGNTLLKSTTATLSNLSGIKDTAQFDYISGSMTFANGYANLKSIQSTGKTLAYYVTGKYNLINGTTNVVILGRLDSTVVALLGPIGELSADKLLSAIPKFGTLTSSIVKTMTSDPAGEKTSSIPELSNGSGNYKDFKVVFNGGIDSTSSVKSFKWLTKVDTSAIESVSVVDTVKSLKSTVNTDLNTAVSTVKETITTQKEVLNTSVQNVKDTVTTQTENVKSTVTDLKNSVDEIKNLFKNK
jgi:hypothetical protein